MFLLEAKLIFPFSEIKIVKFIHARNQTALIIEGTDAVDVVNSGNYRTIKKATSLGGQSRMKNKTI